MQEVIIDFAKATISPDNRTAQIGPWTLTSKGKWTTGWNKTAAGVITKNHQDTIELRGSGMPYTYNGVKATSHTWQLGREHGEYKTLTVYVEPTFRDVPTKPRPRFAPGGHSLIGNLDKPGMVAEWINMTAGGETIGTNGSAFPSAGYGFQISADDCTIRNCQCLVPFSEYFLYVRPGVRNALVENVIIKGGTNFEASIRNAGGQVTLRKCEVIQDHTGIDGKKARTLIRGPGKWTIENCLFAGGTIGCNPMARLNAGQDLGFGEFQLGRGDGNAATSEGGQILRPLMMQSAVQAAIDARAGGKTRAECVRAAIIAGKLRSEKALDLDKLVLDTLWNRDRMLAQRSTVVFKGCTFGVSPDGVPARIEIQPGASVHFIDCKSPTPIVIAYETAYPDNSKYLDRHPTNTNWTLPGDIIRPAPMVRADNFQMAGKEYAVPEYASGPVQ